MKIGNFTLEADTIQVLVVTVLATGAILTLTGFGMLANNWRTQVEQTSPSQAAAAHAAPADAAPAHGGH